MEWHGQALWLFCLWPKLYIIDNCGVVVHYLKRNPWGEEEEMDIYSSNVYIYKMLVF